MAARKPSLGVCMAGRVQECFQSGVKVRPANRWTYGCGTGRWTDGAIQMCFEK